MRMRKFVATSAMLTAALGITAGTAGAAPPAQPTEISSLHGAVAPGIGYSVSAADRSVVLRTAAGRLTTRGNVFEVLDNSGKLITGIPLTYQRDGKEWPIAAKVDGNTATLIPSTDPAEAVPLEPVSMDDYNSALSQSSVEIGLAWAVASVLGTVIGGGIGCVVGALVGTTLMPVIFIAGPIGGCLAGIVAGSALGGVVGNLILGVPVTIGSAINFFNTINRPKP